MIERIVVRNWQSLRFVDLQLGALTVILGESNSGKTALLRALRAIATNVRGTSAITRGEKACAITVHTGAHVVTLERSAGEGGLYRIVDAATGAEDVYTKLGGAVPAAVTAALGLLPATAPASLNFAGQFDPPFLLDDTGAAVARVVGALTKVDIILRAGSEANRRRLSLMSTLRTREADLAAKMARAQELAVTLPARVAARKQAEAHEQGATAVAGRVERLRALVDGLAVVESVLARTAQAPLVPDDTDMRAAAVRLARFKALVRGWATATNAHTAAANAAHLAEAAEAGAQTALEQALAAAGYCPVCNQRVPHLSDHDDLT